MIQSAEDFYFHLLADTQKGGAVECPLIFRLTVAASKDDDLVVLPPLEEVDAGGGQGQSVPIVGSCPIFQNFPIRFRLVIVVPKAPQNSVAAVSAAVYHPVGYLEPAQGSAEHVALQGLHGLAGNWGPAGVDQQLYNDGGWGLVKYFAEKLGASQRSALQRMLFTRTP